MKSTTATRVFPLTPKETWDVLTNIPEYPRLVVSYEDVAVTTPTHLGLGARWTQTRTVFGRSHSQDIEVVGWDPYRSVTHEAHEGGAKYQTRYVLSPSNGKEATVVSVTFTVDARSLFGRMVLGAFGTRLIRATGVQIDRDLSDLSQALFP